MHSPKALGKDQFVTLRNKLGLHDIHSPTWGGVSGNIYLLHSWLYLMCIYLTSLIVNSNYFPFNAQ